MGISDRRMIFALGFPIFAISGKPAGGTQVYAAANSRVPHGTGAIVQLEDSESFALCRYSVVIAPG